MCTVSRGSVNINIGLFKCHAALLSQAILKCKCLSDIAWSGQKGSLFSSAFIGT